MLAAGFAGVLTLWEALGEVEGGPKLPVLTHINQVLRLDAEEARRQYPVELKAVVTFSDPSFGLLFIQDDTAGIYAYQETALNLKPGSSVSVRAVTGSGLFSPVIRTMNVTVRGEGALPEPRPTGLEEIASGAADSQWVEVTGIVQVEEEISGHLRLEIASGLNRCQVWVQHFEGYRERKLLDSLVRFRGVAGAQFDSQRRLRGFELYVASLADMATLEAPAIDALDAAVVESKDLASYDHSAMARHRVHVRGWVTLQQPGQAIYLRDRSGAIQLRTAQTTVLRIGEEIDAAGFRVPGSSGPQLQCAVFKTSGRVVVAKATDTPAAQLLSRGSDRELVRTEVVLLERPVAAKGQAALILSAEGHVGAAFLAVTNVPPSWEALVPGSRLRIAGICRVAPSTEPRAMEFSLWLRTSADLEVLAVPERGMNWSGAWVAGGAGLGLLCGGIPAFWMCRRARRQGMTSAQQTERQLRCYREDRERIGQDLHDNIIQSIYAVGLGLEDCRRNLAKSPEQTGERLGIAVRALNSVIQDIRQFINGLEPKVLNGRDLKTALKSLALTAGEDSSPFTILVESEAAQRLTPQQATQLLNVAKEAMSNSLQHAQASQIHVSLRSVQHGVRLEIRDDGIGFDSQTKTAGGSGIHNMTARARELGARIQIISQPAEGTRVLVDLPGI